MAGFKKTKKWGIFQFADEMIPMQYDSLQFFPFNGNFTAVYKNGKVGFYLCSWSFDNEAKQSVPCIYDDYQRYSHKDGVTRLAVQKNGNWGWVDWYTGEEKSKFIYERKEDLPYPYYKQ